MTSCTILDDVHERWNIVLRSPTDKHESLVSLLDETRQLQALLTSFINEREHMDDSDGIRSGQQLLDRVITKREIVEMQMKSRADASPVRPAEGARNEIKRVVHSVSGEVVAWSLDDDDLPPAGGEAHLLVFERSYSDDATNRNNNSTAVPSIVAAVNTTAVAAVGVSSAADGHSNTNGMSIRGVGAGAGTEGINNNNNNDNDDDELPRSSPYTARYKTPDDNQNPNPPMDPFGAGMSLTLSGVSTHTCPTHSSAASTSTPAPSSSSSSATKSSSHGHVTKRAKSKDERDDELIEGDAQHQHYHNEQKHEHKLGASTPIPSSVTPSAATAATSTTSPAIAVVDEWVTRHPNERYNRVKVLRDTLMGLVVLAIDRKNGEQVAIKLSHRSQVEAGRCLENPLKEAETLRRLSAMGGHRHVLQLLHESKCDSYYWSVLELASKGEFFDLVSRDGRLDNDVARRYFRQLCDGLHFVHSNGLCHLDLSLENCLLTESNELKICDFGVCRELPPDSKLFPGVKDHKPGKLGYMAPEIFACNPYDGRAADIWSLGIVLFIILTGVPPYSIPAASDARFKMVCIQRQLRSLLTHWKMINNVDPLAVELMQMMLSPADIRCSLDTIRSHPWLAATD